jgi:hypothetical protein
VRTYRIMTLAALAGLVGALHGRALGEAMTPKEEVERLMNEGIPFAQKMLTEHGEFYPFGVVMTTTGEIRMVSATTDDEHPTSQELIDKLLAGFQKAAAAHEYKAPSEGELGARCGHPWLL